MAFATAPMRVNVTFLDAGRDKTTRTYHFKPDSVAGTDEVADVRTLVSSLISALSALTMAEILSYDIVLPTIEDAVVVPGAGVELEDTIEYVLQLAALGDKRGTLNVPAPVDAIFVSTSGEQRNIGEAPADDAAVNTFINYAIANLTISDGENLAAAPFIRARRVFKASRPKY